MNQISSYQHCIFIERIHEIISWCQRHDSLNGKHLFYRQWCWNHIWFVHSCSQFRMIPIIAYPVYWNNLQESCSTSTWIWFTASMIFIGRLTCWYRAFNTARMLPLCSCHNRSPCVSFIAVNRQPIVLSCGHSLSNCHQCHHHNWILSRTILASSIHYRIVWQQRLWGCQFA